MLLPRPPPRPRPLVFFSACSTVAFALAAARLGWNMYMYTLSTIVRAFMPHDAAHVQVYYFRWVTVWTAARTNQSPHRLHPPTFFQPGWNPRLEHRPPRVCDPASFEIHVFLSDPSTKSLSLVRSPWESSSESFGSCTIHQKA